MPYVKMPSEKQNLWVYAGSNPPAILSLEFFDIGKRTVKKSQSSSLIVVPDAYKAKPRCQLHLHNMQVVEFDLPDDATERTVLDLLEADE
jgi:hypothetical protein